MKAKFTRAAAIQMVSTDVFEDNLNTALRLIAEAAEAGAGLVVLPENFAVLDGGPQTRYAEAEGDFQAPLQAALSRAAREKGIYLVAGTMPLNTRPLNTQPFSIQPLDTSPASAPGEASRVTDGRVRPASLVFGPDGSIRARYDKIHLFDVEVSDRQARYAESDSFEPGDQCVVVDTEAGKLGLSICYDIRFPELYRRLVDDGAQIITVPAAFTQVTGQAHWEVLLRARAIENQCYIIGAGQGGVHNERRETFGHSMIVDPWGRVLALKERGEGIVFADMDLAALAEIRRKMPVQQHRRLRC